MFQRFTERARQVVVLAEDEARTYKHDHIGTEHLLLGLFRVEEGVAARALGALNVAADGVRDQILRIVGEGGEVTAGQIPFAPRAKKVLELSLREALSLGHDYIGTEHILLGLARESEGVAARVLVELGADEDAIRAELSRLLGVAVGEHPQPTRSWAPFRHQRAPLARPARRWEYSLAPVTLLEGGAEALNALGSDGWELVAVVDDQLIFKRRA